jgi:hypothetical protein
MRKGRCSRGECGASGGAQNLRRGPKARRRQAQPENPDAHDADQRLYFAPGIQKRCILWYSAYDARWGYSNQIKMSYRCIEEE